jgi:sulfatase modifying factor 1
LQQFERVAVVGEPGVGKTTLLRYLAYLYAHDKVEEASDEDRGLENRSRSASGSEVERATFHVSGDAGSGRRQQARRRRTNYKGWQPGHRVPIYISLKDLDDVPDLAEYLTTYFGEHNFPNAGAFIRSKLDSGQFLFLLDALDEVDDPAKQPAVVSLVSRFAHRYSNPERPNWVVVTSRPQTYQAGVQTEDFQVVELLEFEPQQIRDFIVNWFAEEPERGERLWEIMSQDAALLELGGNPLLLSLIVESFDLRNELDTSRRSELFNQIVAVRFFEWDNLRKIRRSFQFTQPVKERFLRQIALELNASTHPLISHRDLLERVRSFLLSDGKRDPDQTDPVHDTLARRFVWEIAEGSGILHQKALDIYDFSHKTLREFFAALCLCDMPNGLGQLLGHLHGPVRDRWEMVALLYAGKTADAAPLIRAIWQADRTLSGRGLILAARCLQDAGNVRDELRLRVDLCDAIFAAIRTAASDEREAGIAILKAIAGTRIEQYVGSLLSEVPAPARLALARDLLPETPSQELQRKMKEALQQSLEVGDEATRGQAAVLLAHANVDEAAQPLLVGLESSDRAIRLQSAGGLARLGATQPAILDGLRRMMRNDGDHAVRLAARNALLLLGSADELTMVRVPAGEFQMGTTTEQAAYLSGKYGYDAGWLASEMPGRRVTLPEFYIDRMLVTNAEFAVFVASTGYGTTAEQQGTGWAKTGQNVDLVEVHGATWEHPRGPGSTWEDIPDHPVVLLSSNDVEAYAEWCGKRLPTEPEWEKAARGTNGRIWPWGDEWARGLCNTAVFHIRSVTATDVEAMQWWAAFDQVRFGPLTTPVGQFPEGQSQYGLLDCAGNVCERTMDWYKPYPGTTDKSEQYGERLHVLRGGAFHHAATLARTTARDFAHPTFRTIHDGFRCVVDAADVLQ